MWYWILQYLLIGPWLRHMVKADVEGHAHLPPDGGYVLAMGSHKTELESVIASVWLRQRKIHFYAKAEYWRKSRLLAWFMTSLGQIPVERGDAAKAGQTIGDGAELLRQGEVIGVYPEGTRSPDDHLHGGYTGFARTLIRAGGHLPVVPVGLVGMESVSPNGNGFLPRKGRVKLVLGKPIYLTRAEQRALRTGGQEAEVAVSRDLTHRVMLAIASLCGKPYDPKRLKKPLC